MLLQLRHAIPLLLSAVLAGLWSTAERALGDTFSTQTGQGNSGPGGGGTAGRYGQGMPAIGQYGRDAECGGTNRSYYDQMYGTSGVVMSPAEMRQHYARNEIIRCGACGQDNVICWLGRSSNATHSGPSAQAPQGQIPVPAAKALAGLIEHAANNGGAPDLAEDGRAHQLEQILREAPRYYPPSHPSPYICLDLMIGAESAAQREHYATTHPEQTADNPEQMADLARSMARRAVCCYEANAIGANEARAEQQCLTAEAPNAQSSSEEHIYPQINSRPFNPKEVTVQQKPKKRDRDRNKQAPVPLQAEVPKMAPVSQTWVDADGNTQQISNRVLYADARSKKLFAFPYITSNRTSSMWFDSDCILDKSTIRVNWQANGYSAVAYCVEQSGLSHSILGVLVR